MSSQPAVGIPMRESALYSYQLDLLKALRRQREKFRITYYYENRDGPPPEINKFENHRDFFETGLLRILSRDDLDNEDIELLPARIAQTLQRKLCDLCGLLNEVANEDNECWSEDAIPSAATVEAVGKYKRLERMLFLVDRSYGPFELARGTRLSLFKFNTLASGMAAHFLVRDFNRFLDGAQFKPRQEFQLSMDTTSKKDTTADIWTQAFDREYRTYIGQIFDTLREEFAKCDAPERKGSHKVMIQLLDVGTLKQPGSNLCLDIFLYCPEPKKWQNTWCKFHRESDQGHTECRKLCQFVKSSLRREEGLILLFDKALATFGRSSEVFCPPKKDPHNYPKLTDLINVHNAFALRSDTKGHKDLFMYPERRSLAAKLALNLLVFCAWRHTSRSWDGDEICFLGSSAKDYEKGKSYITCLVGCDSSKELRTVDDAPIQCFTKFAKLLLEIEYGPLPDGDFSAESDHGYKIIRDFYQDQKDYDDLSRYSYLQAVDSCLRFDKLYQAARTTASGRLEAENETSRRLIRNNIVLNIMKDLPDFLQPPRKRPRRTSFSEEDQISDSDSDGSPPGEPNVSPYAWWGRQHLRKKMKVMKCSAAAGPMGQYPGPSSSAYAPPLTYYVAVHGEMTRRVSLTRRDQPQMMMGATPNQIEESQTVNDDSMFDSKTRNKPLETAPNAEKWFEQLESDIHPILEIKRRTGDTEVRVSVLDTGIDLTHERIQKQLDKNGSKIVAFQDWAASKHGINDVVGHGTAVCDVLLRVAKVHLYVGKISDSAAFDGQTPARVAKAISHSAARDGWNVHIIVLSLGFEREDDEIGKAVLNAFSNGKIILAAASNNGSIDPRKRVSYPARIHGQVLCIRSVEAFGNRAKASPMPSDGDDNFAILGEGIEAAWPPSLNGGRLTRYVSGTSFATPVAAGCAALVLEFSIQRDKYGENVKENRGKLWTYAGIRKIFQFMSTVQDQLFKFDCRVITPWTLFDPNMDYQGYVFEIERQLRNL